MFTGIIEEVGIITELSQTSITIKTNKILTDVKIGDSISVNGVCLTVKKFSDCYFSADVSNETLSVTNLKYLKKDDYVNLERAMSLSNRLGGHIVTGHIDTVARILKLDCCNGFYNLCVEFESKYNKYFVKKGSISINGISLTIAKLTDSTVSVAIIPHTFENTNLKYLKIGDNVNIEFDILAKYVEKNLLLNDNSNITMDLLERNGFV